MMRLRISRPSPTTSDSSLKEVLVVFRRLLPIYGYEYWSTGSCGVERGNWNTFSPLQLTSVVYRYSWSIRTGHSPVQFRALTMPRQHLAVYNCVNCELLVLTGSLPPCGTCENGLYLASFPPDELEMPNATLLEFLLSPLPAFAPSELVGNLVATAPSESTRNLV